MSSGETWVLNETVVIFEETSIEEQINFASNGNQYSKITIDQLNLSGIAYDTTQVYYYPNGWTNTFATPPTGDLLTWLQSNAVKQ